MIALLVPCIFLLWVIPPHKHLHPHSYLRCVHVFRVGYVPQLILFHDTHHLNQKGWGCGWVSA